MMNAILRSFRGLSILMVLLAALSFTACKSKKKAAEAAAAKARLEQEAALKKQQDEEAARKRKEDEDRARRDAEAAKAKESEPYQRLGQYFNSISRADNVTAANGSITEALSMFASPQTPVLIVISESGGQKDYDRPTTIIDYLNYLKDQKKNMNKIEKLQFDSAGKITEVELRKN